MNKLSRCKQRSIIATSACWQRAISPPYGPDCSPGARSPLHYPASQPNWPNSAGKILNISDAGILDALEEPVLKLTESRLCTLKQPSVMISFPQPADTTRAHDPVCVTNKNPEGSHPVLLPFWFTNNKPDVEHLLLPIRS